MISLEETHIFKSNLVNVARIGYSRSVVVAPITLGAINPLASDTSLGFLPGSPAGGFNITGISIFNGGGGGGRENNYYQRQLKGFFGFFCSQENKILKFWGSA